MLVSTIISNGLLLADVANVNFYTAAEQLFAVQLAWEEMYAFLTENNDDYFVTPIYFSPTNSVYTSQQAVTSWSALTCTNAAGATFTTTQTLTLNQPIIFTASSTNTWPSGIAQNTVYYVYNPSGVTFQLVASVGSTTTITVGANAATFTFNDGTIFHDANRNYTWLLDTTSVSFFPDTFWRLRMIQYMGDITNNGYFPVFKMSIENFGNTTNSPGYRFEGKYLAVYDPSNYANYLLWYYPAPITLATTTNIQYPYNALFEAMAYRVAIEVRRKQKAEVGLWESRFKEIMMGMLVQRSRDDSHGEPPKDQFGQGYSPYI